MVKSQRVVTAAKALSILLGGALLSQPAAAVDLIPLLGYTAGGQFEDNDSGGLLSAQESESKGIILAFDESRDKQYELLYNYQNTYLSSDDGLVSQPQLDIDFHYLQFGGNYFFNGRSTFAPYIAGGIGLTLIDPQVANGNDEVRPSMNLAFGANWMLTENLGLRAELRGYGTLMKNATYIACNGGCNIKVVGDLLTQFQLNSGVVFRF